MAKATLFKPTTVLVYGNTSTGKSSLLQHLAVHLWREKGLRTRLYLCDNGSDQPWQAAIDAGIVDLVDLRTLPHAFLWAREVAAGKVPELGAINPKTGNITGRWVQADNSQIGLFAFDSLMGMAMRMLAGLRVKASQDINIGGEGSTKFQDGDGDWGGAVTEGSNNKAHYGVLVNTMERVFDALAQLAVKEQALVVGTAGEERGEQDTSNKGAIIGPKFEGKALTAKAPGMFGLTYHLSIVPNQQTEPKHRLWMVTHQEPSAGNMMALANRRLPLIDPGHEMFAKLPGFIEPASLVGALQARAAVDKLAAEAMLGGK